jgi:hypothetical protein
LLLFQLNTHWSSSWLTISYLLHLYSSMLQTNNVILVQSNLSLIAWWGQSRHFIFLSPFPLGFMSSWFWLAFFTQEYTDWYTIS